MGYWFTFQAPAFLSDLEEKNTEGQLAQKQHEDAGTDWILKWKPILMACGPRDAKEGFLFLKGDYVNNGVRELNNFRCVFYAWERIGQINNTPFKRCSTLKLLMVKIETPWVSEIRPSPYPGLKIQNNQIDCWRLEDTEKWKPARVPWVLAFLVVECHWKIQPSKQILLHLS